MMDSLPTAGFEFQDRSLAPSRVVSREFGRAFDGAQETLRLSELDEVALPALVRAFHGSGSLLYRFDPSGRFLPIAGSLCAEMGAYRAEFFDEDPIHNVLRGLSARRTPIVLTMQAIAVAGLSARGDCRRFYETHAMHDLLGLFVDGRNYGEAGMVGFFVARHRHQGPFSEDDIAPMREMHRVLRGANVRAERMAGSAPEPPLPPSLTGAEREVLMLLGEGLPNAEIARRRFVSVETVKTHLQRIYQKCDVKGRTEAALLTQKLRAY